MNEILIAGVMVSLPTLAAMLCAVVLPIQNEALIDAARMNDLRRLKMLLDQGADANERLKTRDGPDDGSVVGQF